MSNTQGLRFRGVAGLSAAVAVLIGLSCPATADEAPSQSEKLDQALCFRYSAADVATFVAYNQAKNHRAATGVTLERKQQLLKQQLATPEDVEKARSELADAAANVTALEKLIEKLLEKQLTPCGLGDQASDRGVRRPAQ